MTRKYGAVQSVECKSADSYIYTRIAPDIDDRTPVVVRKSRSNSAEPLLLGVGMLLLNLGRVSTISEIEDGGYSVVMENGNLILITRRVNK